MPAQRLTKWSEKHVFNPWMRGAFRAGLVPRAFALLETTGWRTGRSRQTPVGGALVGNAYWLVAEHGTASSYVRNLTAHPRLRVKIGRRWRAGTATFLPDDDAMARRSWINEHNGLIGRIDGVIFRAFAGTAPLTVRIDLDAPGRAQA